MKNGKGPVSELSTALFGCGEEGAFTCNGVVCPVVVPAPNNAPIVFGAFCGVNGDGAVFQSYVAFGVDIFFGVSAISFAPEILFMSFFFPKERSIGVNHFVGAGAYGAIVDYLEK